MADYAIIEIHCPPELTEILMVELTQLGYESFLETGTGFTSSISVELFQKEDVEKIARKYSEEVTLSVKWSDKENWNQKWEEYYPPVKMGKEILIRAPFHSADPSFKHELIIMPKMSFGTGHHETTELMLKEMLRYDFKGKKVLDAGCGTGILGIFAAKLGAESVIAFDIEEWAVENSIENYQLNNETVNVQLGSINVLPEDSYDFILANINKNILIEHLEYYAGHLESEGRMLLSGFYLEDMEDLELMANSFELKKEDYQCKNDWALLILSKTK